VPESAIASNSRVGFSGCNHSSFSFSYSLGFNLGTVRESACSGTAYLPVAAGPQALISTDPEYRHVQTALHDLPYLLRCTSPAVDMGDSAVTDEDSTFPPSWGAPHNDIGAYGGPGGALAMDDTERAYVAGQLLSVSKTSISWCALPSARAVARSGGRCARDMGRIAHAGPRKGDQGDT
jgi:hypothetical protein